MPHTVSKAALPSVPTPQSGTQVGVHFNRPAQRLTAAYLTLSDNRIGLALLPSCSDAPLEEDHQPATDGLSRRSHSTSGHLRLPGQEAAAASTRCTIEVSQAVVVGSSGSSGCDGGCGDSSDLPDPLDASTGDDCGAR